MRRPLALPGYDLSSEMGPKSHTTIIVPIREARTCLLIRQLLIRELAVPPPPDGMHCFCKSNESTKLGDEQTPRFRRKLWL
ncbi:hypothetical protein AVEN_9426-1 [Araneus ventricosus]|uniref:Uncharacterized protein n=1 Tax=Araneus ventricosus TaxID=182803 RepID=A0A4Y2FI98_ARAVE|nr:hypothetical protein AVEN_9426-1 [Araneus ventricosus]